MEKHNKRIKVCFLSGAISRSGGTERVGSIIANSLAKSGFDVTILSVWDHGTPFFKVREDVTVGYLLNPRTEGKLYRTYIYPVIKLHHFIKKFNFDVIIDIDTELARFTSYAIIGTTCKQISWEHFNYWAMQRLGERKRFRAKSLIKKHASKLVVLTEQDRLKHLQEYNLPRNFVVTMPNPCPSPAKAKYNFENKTFLAVGRLTEQKNFGALIDAWALIVSRCPEWNLKIVGSGEEETSLRSQARDLKNIEFVGKTDDVSKYYLTSSCLVLSSLYEGFPMVILEAQSYGLPVISFDCKTGPRDLVIDNKNGYLIEDQNVQLLSERMLEFTKSREKANELSHETFEDIKHYNLESITKKWALLLKEVVQSV